MHICPFILIAEYRFVDGPILVEYRCVLGEEHIGPHISPPEGHVVASAPSNAVGKWIKRGVPDRVG